MLLVRKPEGSSQVVGEWLMIGGLVFADLVSKGWARGSGLGVGVDKNGLWFLLGLVLLFLSVKDLGRVVRVLLLAGGVGNLAERLWMGRITDWLELPVVGLWFNLADLWLTLGVAWIVINEIRKYERKAHSVI